MRSYEVTWLDRDQKTRISIVETSYPDLLAFKMHELYGNKFQKIKKVEEVNGRKDGTQTSS
jgi:hypothetical protein